MKKLFLATSLLFATAIATPSFANKVYIGDKTTPIDKVEQKKFTTCMNSFMNPNFADIDDIYPLKNKYVTSIDAMSKIFEKHISKLEKLRNEQILRMKKADTDKNGELSKEEIMSACGRDNLNNRKPMHKPMYKENAPTKYKNSDNKTK